MHTSKEDPHWCRVIGFLKGVGDHYLAELWLGSISRCLGCEGWLAFLLLVIGGGSSHSLLLSILAVVE